LPEFCQSYYFKKIFAQILPENTRTTCQYIQAHKYVLHPENQEIVFIFQQQ